MSRPKGQHVDVEPLVQTEYEKIIPYLKPHWQLFFELLWQTGIRVSEGLGIVKTDLESGGIWVIREKRPKNPLRDWIPLTGDLYNRIDAEIGHKHRQLVFPFTKQAAWLALKIAATRAGVRIDPVSKETTLHPHCFRHGFGHRAERAGVSIPQMQRMFGHAHIESTYVYVKPTKSETIAAFRRLNETVPKQKLIKKDENHE